MKRDLGLALFIGLNLIVVALMDLALFSQTTGKLKTAPWHRKLFTSEKWATIQWLFIVPMQRIGNKFLTAPQLGLSSFVFDFIGQIASNRFWLKIPTTVDDWSAMGLIIFAMYISVYNLVG